MMMMMMMIPFQPYFCGLSDYCLSQTDAHALETAVNNIEKHFSVVGVLERFNDTLEALEYTVPLLKGIRARLSRIMARGGKFI